MSKEVIRPSQFRRATIVDLDFAELSDTQKRALDELYEGTASKLKTGELITGKVVAIDSNGVIVDIEYKSNGLVPRYEFSEVEMKELKPGEEIEVILDQVEGPDGTVSVSYEKAKAMRAWDRISELFNAGKPIKGVVSSTVKGGLSVDIGVPAFLPGSQVDVQRVTDFEQYVGQTITAEILKINRKRGNVIISRRKYLAEQRAEQRREAMATLTEGQVIQGQVKNITNYGVFIDIGGIDGLLHITDMTWGRISHPSELVKISDTVTVKVIAIDKDNSKISLGMKQLSDNPWKNIEERFQPNTKVSGKISSITEYGMFVEVGDGVEGLIHISEISWTERINNLRDLYQVGQTVEAVVVSLDTDNRRMSLSIKQLQENPWKVASAKFKVGDKVAGTVSNITDFGIFIQLMPGIDGLAHISDLSWTEHIEHPGNLYKKGDSIEAIILSIDEDNKKISLGIKQLHKDPWENIEKEYEIGKLVDGTVTKLTTFGAFVRLPSGVEGLVPNNERELGGKLEDTLKVGDAQQFRVINMSREDRKITLSTRLEGPIQQERYSENKRKAGGKRREAAMPLKEAAPIKSALQIELEKLQQRQLDEEKGE